MYKKFEMELAGRTLRVDVDRVAKQANGAVLMHYGDTTVLCTATASEKPREGIDFFPLSVKTALGLQPMNEYLPQLSTFSALSRRKHSAKPSSFAKVETGVSMSASNSA